MPLAIPNKYCIPFTVGNWRTDYFGIMISHLSEFKIHAANIYDDLHSKSLINDRDKNIYVTDTTNTIEDFCKFYNLYKEGKRNEAHIHFNTILKKYSSFFETPAVKKRYPNRWTSFYRMRNDGAILKDKKLKGNEKYTLFHIPFTKRHRCNTARFNSHGTPILYVSDDIQTTWLEMNKTCHDTTSGKDRVDVGVFQNSIVFDYYDLEVKDINTLLINSAHDANIRTELLNYLYLYPLICGLHTDVDYLDEYAAYKCAYVMPSLFMEYFINERLSGSGFSKIFAFKYSSVKRGANAKSSNFAFFPHQKDHKQDYCTELGLIFMIKRANFYHEEMLSVFKYDKITPTRLNRIKTHLVSLIP